MSKGITYKKKKTKHIYAVFMNLFAWVITITALYPVAWMAYSAVKDNKEFMVNTLSLPSKLMFTNFPKAFEVGQLWLAMGNSAFYAAVNVALTVVFAIITAYFLARYDFKGKKIINFIYVMGMLIPLYALLVPIFVQYKMLDMLNNRLTLIITYYATNVSLGIFLTESFIQGIPMDIDEASVIDGCSISQRLIKIIFPLCKPIIATVSILTLLNTWNEFAFAVILTPDIKMRTVSVAIRYFTSGRHMDYTFLMAALLCTSLPVIIAYLLFSKEVIKGMTAGAVKG